MPTPSSATKKPWLSTCRRGRRHHLRPAVPAPNSDLHQALENITGKGGVISHPDELIVYECDGFTIPRAKPLAVVFPKSTEQVAAVVGYLREKGIAILPRGSGTGLTGGIVSVVPGVQV